MKKIIKLSTLIFLVYSCTNSQDITDIKNIKANDTTSVNKGVFIRMLNDTALHKPKMTGLLFCNYSKDTIYVISLKSLSQPNDKIRLLPYNDIHLSEAGIKGDWGGTSPFFFSGDFDTIRLIPEENRFLNLPLSYFSKKLIDSLEFSYKYFKGNISDTSEVRCLDGFVYKVNKYRQYKRKRW